MPLLSIGYDHKRETGMRLGFKENGTYYIYNHFTLLLGYKEVN